jgi:hypothetical protein
MRLQTTLAVLGIVVAACGGDIDAGGTTTTAVEATTTTVAHPTTTLAPTTTTVAPTSTTLAGEPADMGPSSGAILAVIGVSHDDVLNLRAGPGADQPILGRIPPTYDELIAGGETRRIPGAFWTKVRYEGTEGWVNMRYIAYLGSVDDITAQVIAQLGERPEASTMTELGQILAEALASDDPPSDIVNSVEESSGDLGEVTFDVVGVGDDAIRGVRLHIFGENLDGHFQLRTIEQTLFCDPARGVDEGSCV